MKASGHLSGSGDEPAAGVSASGFYAWVDRRRPGPEDIGLTARRSIAGRAGTGPQASMPNSPTRVARGPADACGVTRRAGSPFRHHDSRRSDGGPRAGSGRPPVHRRGAGPPLGRRHHLHPDVGRLSLPRHRADVWSRRVVGWALEVRTELVLRAALTQRRPEAVVHHSDRGCLHQLRLRQTMPATR